MAIDTARAQFDDRGWCVLPAEPAISDWVDAVRSAAEAALTDPALSHWYQCDGTWFVGVDALPTDETGAVAGGPPILDAGWAELWRGIAGPVPPLHPAQLSVVFPGYPRPRQRESAAAFRYREWRFAAHVDGLHGEGPARRRFLKEPHAFILGLPLNDAQPHAAPLMVWEGSHRAMAAALRAVLDPHPLEDWPHIDVTDAYHAARRAVFDAAEAVAVTAQPGEAILLHRHLLHGIGAWGAAAPEDPAGRRIAYFRPEFSDPSEWLTAP